MSYDDLAKNLSLKSAVNLRQAEPQSLAAIQKLGSPPYIIDFYREYEPQDMIEINRARLWPIAVLLVENSDYVPGAYVCTVGFVVIGTTEYGDAYCVDLNCPNDLDEHPIVLLPHDIDYDEILPGPLSAVRKVVANNFRDFLTRFVQGDLDIEPQYEIE